MSFVNRSERVLRSACEFYGLKRADMVSRTRKQPNAKARQVAMFLMREITPLSSTRVGMIFDRDHTTVLKAQKVVTGNPTVLDEAKAVRLLMELTYG